MNLFIIGNGFDLAHNLPTRYEDFKNYLFEIDSGFCEFFLNNYSFPKTFANPLATEPL